jgi:hypothetical protein
MRQFTPAHLFTPSTATSTPSHLLPFLRFSSSPKRAQYAFILSPPPTALPRSSRPQLPPLQGSPAPPHDLPYTFLLLGAARSDSFVSLPPSVSPNPNPPLFHPALLRAFHTPLHSPPTPELSGGNSCLGESRMRCFGKSGRCAFVRGGAPSNGAASTPRHGDPRRAPPRHVFPRLRAREIKDANPQEKSTKHKLLEIAGDQKSLDSV